jgi:hypothetical protein
MAGETLPAGVFEIAWNKKQGCGWQKAGNSRHRMAAGVLVMVLQGFDFVNLV